MFFVTLRHLFPKSSSVFSFISNTDTLLTVNWNLLMNWILFNKKSVKTYSTPINSNINSMRHLALKMRASLLSNRLVVTYKVLFRKEYRTKEGRISEWVCSEHKRESVLLKSPETIFSALYIAANAGFWRARSSFQLLPRRAQNPEKWDFLNQE